jgi:hypothetical protein
MSGGEQFRRNVNRPTRQRAFHNTRVRVLAMLEKQRIRIRSGF